MPMKRLTRQRRAVLEVLRGTKSHPDAAWVYQEVRKRIPSISLGTVYRTLDALVKEGLVMPLHHGGGATRYDANTMPHPHLYCRRCGAVVDLDLEPPDILKEASERHPELKFETFQLEFEGLCAECAGALAS